MNTPEELADLIQQSFINDGIKQVSINVKDDEYGLKIAKHLRKKGLSVEYNNYTPGNYRLNIRKHEEFKPATPLKDGYEYDWLGHIRKKS